jgi:hypothetical protein
MCHSVIRGNDDLNEGPDDIKVDLSTEQLDTLLSSVSVLNLKRVQPQWNSRAYHGLVELRLKGMYSSVYIKEVELVSILRTSPGLRVLELGVEIDDPLPTDAQVTEIPLEDLEVLDLSKTRCYWHSTLLRWLAPGPKALQFILRRGKYENIEVKRSLGPFLSRSRVTNVCETGLELMHILELLELCPNLRELAVSWADAHKPDPLQIEQIGVMALPHLECLYLTGAPIHIEDIVTLLKAPAFLVMEVAFYNCTLLKGGVSVTRDQEEAQLKELHLNNPDVTLMRRTDVSSSIKDWKVFD